MILLVSSNKNFYTLPVSTFFSYAKHYNNYIISERLGGWVLVVYADVLIVLNLFVNFFILKFTCLLCKEQCRFGRVILASLVGAGFS
ncbi:MAG: sigma-E processing peptidase SpoIIGA, partial [Clostridia bacterium]|nr:sigma-E processing peptidase SpoIIGA [Clostridia bacterium]